MNRLATERLKILLLENLGWFTWASGWAQARYIADKKLDVLIAKLPKQNEFSWENWVHLVDLHANLPKLHLFFTWLKEDLLTELKYPLDLYLAFSISHCLIWWRDGLVYISDIYRWSLLQDTYLGKAELAFLTYWFKLLPVLDQLLNFFVKIKPNNQEIVDFMIQLYESNGEDPIDLKFFYKSQNLSKEDAINFILISLKNNDDFIKVIYLWASLDENYATKWLDLTTEAKVLNIMKQELSVLSDITIQLLSSFPILSPKVLNELKLIEIKAEHKKQRAMLENNIRWQKGESLDPNAPILVDMLGQPVPVAKHIIKALESDKNKD